MDLNNKPLESPIIVWPLTFKKVSKKKTRVIDFSSIVCHEEVCLLRELVIILQLSIHSQLSSFKVNFPDSNFTQNLRFVSTGKHDISSSVFNGSRYPSTLFTVVFPALDWYLHTALIQSFPINSTWIPDREGLATEHRAKQIQRLHYSKQVYLRLTLSWWRKVPAVWEAIKRATVV